PDQRKPADRCGKRNQCSNNRAWRIGSGQELGKTAKSDEPRIDASHQENESESSKKAVVYDPGRPAAEILISVAGNAAREIVIRLALELFLAPAARDEHLIVFTDGRGPL